MIKLIAIDPPSELTPELVKKLTEEFKNNPSAFKTNKSKAIWRQNYVKVKLLEMSHDKCCYCEREIEIKTMHVEHFYPKDTYKEQVLEWSNLLPSCSICNTVKKRTLDTKKYPIIHPVKDVPKQHLRVKKFYLYPKDDLGKFTIDKLDLNETDLSMKRYEYGLFVTKQLQSFLLNFTRTLSSGNIILDEPIKIELCRELEGIMQHGIKRKKFSAVISTTILTNDDYKEIKQLFMKHNLWTDELIDLEQEVEFCALI